ncbi:MAG: DUF4212 domain-containing protein [Rhodocyclaceae bacterium]|nr:DUF4212 domain-containing protein [Rhodocyclaceae bacterium]
MQPKPAQRYYWKKNIRLTLVLLAAWFVVTFVAGYFAAELNQFSFFGFPVGFYAFAQGALIAYLLIVAIYVRYMNRLDRDWAHESIPGEARTRFPATRDN